MTANNYKPSANAKETAIPDSGTYSRLNGVSFESDKPKNYPLKLKKINPKTKNGAKHAKEEPMNKKYRDLLKKIETILVTQPKNMHGSNR